MDVDKIIKLGLDLGLKFDRRNNFESNLEKGTVVFDGINGQRFRIQSSWKESEILHIMGKYLIELGERKKVMEINQVLSIN